MSQLETLRETIKMMKSMVQPTRHPIIIATPPKVLYNNNAVRAILGAPVMLRDNDGTYARDERGFLIHDQMATYKANRVAVPSDYSLDDIKFTDYVKALTNIPVSEVSFRRMQLRPRRHSPYEMALWGGIQWGGRTNAAATEHALRQVIQKTIPKARPYLVKRRYYCRIINKCLSMGNLCNESFGLCHKYFWLNKQQRKQQEIIDDRFHADPIRLSTEFTAAYAQLPIDGRFAMSLETYEWACKTIPRPFHNSTGHWD